MSGQIRILVVDDESVTRLMVRRVLLDSGYDVMEAEDGKAAVASCREHLPDLVLMDVRMPAMNGFDACRAIRKLPSGQLVPILMLTGLDDVMAVTLAFEAGATDFITKPINWALLGQRLRYALRTNRTARRLRDSQQLLDRAQRIAQLGQWTLSMDGLTLTCSSEMREMLGLDDDVALDCDALLQRVVQEDRPRLAAFLDRLQSGGGEEPVEVRFHVGQGMRHLAWSGSLSLDDHGRPKSCFGVVQDLTDRRDAEAQLNYQAHFDALTGLPNRVLLRDRLRTAVTASHRGGTGFAVMELRTNAMARARAAGGPAAADRVLRAVAEHLSGLLRERDTLSHLGGERFVLLVSDVNGEVDAGTVAQRLTEAFSNPLVVDDWELLATVHAGVALYPADGDEPEALLRSAAAAQARAETECARESGYRFFTEGIQERVARTIATQVALFRGLERGEFELHFQPVVQVTDQRCVGVEALLRWRRPGVGLQMPDTFIAMLEQTGLILDAGEWVLRSAIASIKAMPISLAINVSPRQLQHPNIANRLLRVAEEMDFPPSRLEIEITEQAVLHDEERAFAALHDMAARGVRIALDDYGVGYSSLHRLKQLQRLPLHALKIDRAFVTTLLSDTADAAIVRSTIDLCHELGILVVAEGVEDDSTLERLSSFGCDLAQGYGIGRPMPPSGLGDWMSNSRFGSLPM